MNVKYLLIHHSAVSRSIKWNQYWMMKLYHISRGWGDIGYHYVIEPSGEVRKGRPDNKLGVHTVGYNHNSLGICLSGNFSKENPTDEQVYSLQELLLGLSKAHRIPLENIISHREVSNTQCYGNNLTNDWARNLIKYMTNVKLVQKKDSKESG